MATDSYPRIQVRIADDLATWLDDRFERMHAGGRHEQARTELLLWQGALRAELGRIRLTLGQACCLADVCNGWLLDASLGSLVFAEASDAFMIARDGPAPELSSYARKWDIDEDELLGILRRLGPTADHALRDALNRWWDDEHEQTAEGFAAVGLTIVDAPRPTIAEG